jgi:hypothetical protein
MKQPASARPQTHALDRAAAGIGKLVVEVFKNFSCLTL